VAASAWCPTRGLSGFTPVGVLSLNCDLPLSVNGGDAVSLSAMGEDKPTKIVGTRPSVSARRPAQHPNRYFPLPP